MFFPLSIAAAAFAVRRTLYALKFFQQEGYSNIGFIKFIFRRGQFVDKKLTLALFLLVGIPMLIDPWYAILAMFFIMPATFAIFAWFEKSPFKGAKKKLVMTARAKRIFAVAMIIDIMAGSTLIIPVAGPILFVQFLPFSLIIANIILWPVERLGQWAYLRSAKRRLAEVNPIVIGITGSFGKTSTKNILAHVLGPSAITTARSINTLMGLTQAIRSTLLKTHKYFIAEIGTDRPGKIARACRLVQPKYGILTSIGSAHFENFGSGKALAKEKTELLLAVARNKGAAVANASRVAVKLPPGRHILFRAEDITNLKQGIDGISFTFSFEGEKHRISAPLWGGHQAENIAAAFIMARVLGVPAATIIARLKTTPQIPHRLEVRRGPITVIDDGFNSNVDGFLSALVTLRQLAGKGRAILITPGMVELGARHSEQHETAGKAAAKAADLVIAVRGERIRDFTRHVPPGKLVEVRSFAEATEWMTKHARPGDAVLYENDLPDVFEEKISV
ncbi:MAG: UDP-N-acetylmuramoyl-tripeptide--D-alanyl-D-alanine ligase [Rickettsiales bacterium]|nr:UDP-N-acetylmuramoyl-tripeptide--D-alanyl-D-alanine ligase [Rickettsiales bacterium]